MIGGTSLAEPLILELFRAVLQAGGLPHVRMEPTLGRDYFFRYASDQVLDTLPDLTRQETELMDVSYYVLSAANTRDMNEVDPKRIVRSRRTFEPVNEIHSRRAAAGDLLWSVTLYPTPAYAQDAEMSLVDYAEFVFEASFLNDEDPVARWRQLSGRQQILVDHLNAAHEVVIRGAGTDLTLNTSGRKWINSDGTRNFPSGEVFTGPVENQVEGHITFGFPAVYGGREVRGVQLWFEEGRVVKAQADHNEAYLLEMLETDKGARYLGEVAFGTNTNIQRFMRNTLFDEKIGGTMHLALGRSYPETGGENKSAIHWDLVCDLRTEGEVLVDGEVLMQDGRFTILEGGVT